MAYDVVRPLMHEVLTMVNNAKVKGKKIEVLRKYSSEGLKMVLKFECNLLKNMCFSIYLMI